ncbi:hypothetical protein IPH19_01135 [Candidatus Uhrbacteria bacterium]|nr:MAG: hypothetical protein IPH19_01135 [Candidatus Uhrbacteria bacterium]
MVSSTLDILAGYGWGRILLDSGSIAGFISLLFTLKEQIKKRSKFKFDFRGSAGSVKTRNGLDFYDIAFDGYVKNQSNEQNSITEIFYVIWGNKKRTRTLAEGMGAEIFTAADNEKKLSLPILFEPKEGKHLIIKFSVCLTGSHVYDLVRARKPAQAGSIFTLPKHDFTLTFKDVNEVLFDDKGQIRSQKLINLWWTLPNTFITLKTGNPFPYLWHMVKILFAYLAYRVFSVFQRIGF